MKRAIGTAVVAMAMVLAGSVGVASAHKVKYKSVVEIDAYLTVEGAFLGSVGSFDSKSCGGKRKVSLWKKNPGAMDGPFGTAKSRSGSWRIDVVAPPGSYYAVVKKRTVQRSKKHRHVCSADRSSVFQIG